MRMDPRTSILPTTSQRRLQVAPHVFNCINFAEHNYALFIYSLVDVLTMVKADSPVLPLYDEVTRDCLVRHP